MRLVVIALGVMLLCAGPAVAVDHAAILQYHHVDDTTPASTSVTVAQFSAQLARLADAGFHHATLPEIMAAVTSDGVILADSTFGLTADDGYASLLDHALPLLRARGWTMAVFVCPEQVDIGRPLHLDWEDLRTLRTEGWTIANHSLAHEHLVRRRPGESESDWRKRVTDDITAAQTRLEQELGDVPRHLAYPYGEYDPELLAIVRDLGFIGFGQHSGPVGPLTDLAVVPRFPASGVYADPDDLVFKAATLPLPVTAHDPASPVLPDDMRRPELTITLADGDWSADQLAAYASGQGRIEVTAVADQPHTFRVRAREPLPDGRSRYNVTAPGRDGRRWYWASFPWLRPAGAWWEE